MAPALRDAKPRFGRPHRGESSIAGQKRAPNPNQRPHKLEFVGRVERWIVMRNLLILTLVLLATGVARAGEASNMSNEAFLDEWQKRCFAFLWEQADPNTGLVADRAPADGSKKSRIASIASVGFALTAIPIAQERGWVTEEEAYERVLTTLRFLYHDMPHVEGFYYHFVDIHTGERVWECELSSVDTALLLGGVLTAGQYYAGTEVEDLAVKIYHRVNWPWMMNGGRTLSLGWKPESGFIPYYWDNFSEHMLLQLLGLGSPTHPLPPDAWHAWRRSPLVHYDGMSFLSHPPLFVHQFSHAWVDFRDKRDDYADYWFNSVLATKAQRRMAIAMHDRFPHYGPNAWGITSSDSEYGYTAWGGPTPSEHINGTLVPCAAAGSIPFLPEESIAAVRHMYDTWGEQIWKKYGMVDAFNPHTGWAAKDVIGIDVGITLLMIENYRTGFVWEYFMRNPAIQKAMQVAGFRPLHPQPQVVRNTSVFAVEVADALRERLKVIEVPRRGGEPTPVQWHKLDLSSLELGRRTDGNEVEARFSFTWDEQTLYLTVDVKDNQVEAADDPAKLYSKDLVELFVDPQNDGLVWGDPADFQFGFGVPNQVWEWFGQRGEIHAEVTRTPQGYRVEAGIPFKLLKVQPAVGETLGASVAVKSNDPTTHDPLKLNWSFTPHIQRIYLGELHLVDAPTEQHVNAGDADAASLPQ